MPRRLCISETAEVISFEFNVQKSHCIAIGKRRNSQITPMSLCGNPVEWCETIEYLGVYLESGSSVRFNVSPAKRAFYTAWNAIFLCSSGVNEIALLHLQETYSLSVLMYATPSLNLTNRQVSELNACWNNVIQIVWLLQMGVSY